MFFSRRIQRLALGMAIFAMTTVAMGCGKNRVNLDVDVTSFISAEDLTGEYMLQAPAIVPTPPPGTPPPAVPTLSIELDPVEVNLLEGSQDFVNAEELSIDVAISYDNTSGDAIAEFELLFSDSPLDVFNTAAVVSIPATLIAGVESSSAARFDADARVLALFTQDQIYMGLRFNYTPTSAEDLAGTYTITSLIAHVVSTVEIF